MDTPTIGMFQIQIMTQVKPRKAKSRKCRKLKPDTPRDELDLDVVPRLELGDHMHRTNPLPGVTTSAKKRLSPAKLNNP